MARPIEARMKYGWCRVNRLVLDTPGTRIFRAPKPTANGALRTSLPILASNLLPRNERTTTFQSTTSAGGGKWFCDICSRMNISLRHSVEGNVSRKGLMSINHDPYAPVAIPRLAKSYNPRD